jgi:hypothetical protein
MKKFVLAAMLAVVGVTPVLAKAPFNQQIERPSHAAGITGPRGTVILDGKVVGKDPSADVRLSLRRDAYGGWE